MVWNVHIDELFANPLGDFVTSVRAYLRGFEARGWPKLILSAGDEADVNGTIGHTLPRLRLLKKSFPAHRIYTTIVRPHNSEVFEPVVDVRAFSSYGDETMVESTRKAGRELWVYSGSSGFGLDPIGDRLYRGLWAAKLTLDGVLDWTYWWQATEPGSKAPSFNDLAGPGHRPHLAGCWVVPAPDGPLPSLGWEAMREGVDDGKYVFTVQSLIREKLATGNEKDRRRAQAAQAVLDRVFARVVIEPAADAFAIRNTALRLDAAFFDGARNELARQILLLSDE